MQRALLGGGAVSGDFSNLSNTFRAVAWRLKLKKRIDIL
jgi:hypothetical protein